VALGALDAPNATLGASTPAPNYSEGALYKHFRDKTEIFLSVLAEHLPDLDLLLTTLPERAGEQTVAENLTEFTRGATDFYVESFPIAMSLFSSQDLLATHRTRVGELGVGPHLPGRRLADYLAAEQRLGRLAPDANPVSAAALLLAACFQQAFLVNFSGETQAPDELDAMTSGLVTALIGKLA
jgi:AcrR family transcriptional regulator